MFTETAVFPVCFRAAVFSPVFCGFMPVLMHTQAQRTDGDAVIVNAEIVLVSEISGMSGVQVDKRSDIFLSAVIIDSVSVVGGIQKEFFNAESRKIRLHGEK